MPPLAWGSLISNFAASTRVCVPKLAVPWLRAEFQTPGRAFSPSRFASERDDQCCRLPARGRPARPATDKRPVDRQSGTRRAFVLHDLSVSDIGAARRTAFAYLGHQIPVPGASRQI